MIVLGVLCLFFLERLLAWAKLIMSLANLFFTVAIVMVPIGFAWLDDRCPVSAATDAQCGLVCNGGQMNFFSLCAPFSVGGALWTVIGGIFVLFVGALVISCLHVRPVTTTTYVVTRGIACISLQL